MGNQPQEIGPWVIQDELGHGGNATVWRARRKDDSDEIVALKVVRSAKADREPYRRFVHEIEFLRSAGDLPGVLPVVDAHLPERPSRKDRPWLAMPVAQPISVALSGTGLEVVVKAVATVAETLSRLAADHRVAHRDIKPGNLYELNGSFLVGDFGLIDLPDVEELTRADRPLGPAHYTAYELIADPEGADPFPADVYSLGKTLWVLATEQRYPPEGHQPAETRKYSIADMRRHPHAAASTRSLTCGAIPMPLSLTSSSTA